MGGFSYSRQTFAWAFCHFCKGWITPGFRRVILGVKNELWLLLSIINDIVFIFCSVNLSFFFFPFWHCQFSQVSIAFTGQKSENLICWFHASASASVVQISNGLLLTTSWVGYHIVKLLSYVLLKEGDVITTSSYMTLHLPTLSCGHSLKLFNHQLFMISWYPMQEAFPTDSWRRNKVHIRHPRSPTGSISLIFLLFWFVCEFPSSSRAYKTDYRLLILCSQLLLVFCIFRGINIHFTFYLFACVCFSTAVMEDQLNIHRSWMACVCEMHPWSWEVFMGIPGQIF